jgi:hypothetical protein
VRPGGNRPQQHQHQNYQQNGPKHGNTPSVGQARQKRMHGTVNVQTMLALTPTGLCVSVHSSHPMRLPANHQFAQQ